MGWLDDHPQYRELMDPGTFENIGLSWFFRRLDVVHDYWSGFGRGLQAQNPPAIPGPMLCKWRYELKFHQSIGINKSMYVFEVFWSSGQKKKRSLALTFMSMCEHWIHLYRELAWNKSEHRDWIETCNLVLDCSLLKLLTILKPHLTLVKEDCVYFHNI